MVLEEAIGGVELSCEEHIFVNFEGNLRKISFVRLETRKRVRLYRENDDITF